MTRTEYTIEGNQITVREVSTTIPGYVLIAKYFYIGSLEP